MPFAGVRTFPRVLLGFRCYDDRRRAIARRPATTFGAGALIQSGGKSSREALGANRRLNSPLLRRRLDMSFHVACHATFSIFIGKERNVWLLVMSTELGFRK